MANFVLMPPGASSPIVFTSKWTLEHIDRIYQCIHTDSKSSKLLKILPSLYNELDIGAKAGFANLYMIHLGMPVLYARDTQNNCYYLGAPRDFFAKGGMLVNIPGAPEVIFIHRPEKPAFPAKIPRPPNAYILYRKERHHSIKAQRPDITNNEISQVLGRLWNSETREVRALYKQIADQKKAEHRRQYPDYQYRPRRPSERRRRNNASSDSSTATTAVTQQMTA
ncbi:mating type [Fusarium coicis]|uniref:Mating type protein 1-2-1 n=1 Tax=Fusarium coicis TaxID=1567539 RepID=A0A5J6YHL8_9HYPO|nr:mating type [Fusarium coicis]QFP39835.1 mating type protein 1-2-1 [Fusarium coicis]